MYFKFMYTTNSIKNERNPTKSVVFIAKVDKFKKNIGKFTKNSLQMENYVIYYRQEIREDFEISFLFHYNSPPKTKRSDEKNSQLLIVFAFYQKIYFYAVVFNSFLAL